MMNSKENIKDAAQNIFEFINNDDVVLCIISIAGALLVSLFLTILMHRWLYSFFHKGEIEENLKKEIVINHRVQIDVRTLRPDNIDGITKHIGYRNTYYIKVEKTEDRFEEDRRDTGELPMLLKDTYVKIEIPPDLFGHMTADENFKRLRIRNNSGGDIALARMIFTKRPNIDLYEWDQYMMSDGSEMEVLVNMADEPQEIIIDYSGTGLSFDISRDKGFASFRIQKRK